MTHHDNLKIIAFIGMSASDTPRAITHFTEKGIPKIHFKDHDTASALSQVEHLSDAGQHRIVVDAEKWEECEALMHAFPGAVTTVSTSLPSADYAIKNDGSSEDFEKSLDTVAAEIDFLT